jgi:hydrogenase maturation factor
VIVGANDIATAAATPRWFLSTVLLPPGTTVAYVEKLFSGIHETCSHLGLVLSGGHTEVTDAVTKPVVVGHVAGSVSRMRLLTKKAIRKGDQILLTKALAVEGTAILAREFPAQLRALGLTEEDLRRCRKMLFKPGISILPEARIASRAAGVKAMHDITEGGLSTALYELSVAGEHEILVDANAVPVFPETARLCALTSISPLGLIASGSLLIVLESSHRQSLIGELEQAGIQACRIGEVLESGSGIQTAEPSQEWPSFSADEIVRATRFLESL